jgi:hypothetical protein
MNTLLRKEFRLLLPAWIAALAAATLPLWFQWRNWVGPLAMSSFCLAAMFLGLAPFGQEMSCGTFALLLVQPEKRQRLWRVKAGLLAAALLSAWALSALCWWICEQKSPLHLFFNPDLRTILEISGTATLAAFSGGLWTTLLLRDATAAFFATLMAPTALIVAAQLALIHWTDNNALMVTAVVGGVMAAYSVAGYLVARRLFLGAEDVPLAWIGRQVALPRARLLPSLWTGFGFQEKRGPWCALIIKELQLQEVTMVIVPLIALLHLAALAARHFAPAWAARMQVFDFAGFLWLVAPYVVGCVAVAEERRYNTLENLLCQPVRKRDQFLVKFAVVMALGTLLGGVFPWVLEKMGGGNHVWIVPEGMIKWFLSGAAAVAAIAFFASTMSRNLLQAFTVAFVTLYGSAAAFEFLTGGIGMERSGAYQVFLHGSSLVPALAWPALLLAYFWLAFRNYKCLQTGWRLWAGNFIRLAAVFAAIWLVAGAIFDRSWECLMPLEPPHGPARLSGPGRAMMADSLGHQICVLLPDGRLWAGKLDASGEYISGRFAGGSNWVDLAGAYASRAAVALKSDGTLWRLSGVDAPQQMGPDSDWKKVVAGSSLFLALKQDGTIWGWGTDECGILSSRPDEHGRGLAFPDRFQVWQESDWVDVFVLSSGQQAVAVKRDGSVWKWGYDGMGMNGRIYTYPYFHQLVRLNMAGTNWSSLAGWNGAILGVRADGTLWAGDFSGFWPSYYGEFSLFGSPIPTSAKAPLARIGDKSDWVGVCFSGAQFLALEADGTFWAIDRFSHETKRPSRYHDWLALTAIGGTDWAVAKDGTITCWADFSRRFIMPPWDQQRQPWFFLRPSRRPLASLNILDAK